MYFVQMTILKPHFSFFLFTLPISTFKNKLPQFDVDNNIRNLNARQQSQILPSIQYK